MSIQFHESGDSGVEFEGFCDCEYEGGNISPDQVDTGSEKKYSIDGIMSLIDNKESVKEQSNGVEWGKDTVDDSESEMSQGWGFEDNEDSVFDSEVSDLEIEDSDFEIKYSDFESEVPDLEIEDSDFDSEDSMFTSNNFPDDTYTEMKSIDKPINEASGVLLSKVSIYTDGNYCKCFVVDGVTDCTRIFQCPLSHRLSCKRCSLLMEITGDVN